MSHKLIFLIHFSSMFLIVSDLFYAKLWNIPQLCVLQVLIEKRENSSIKEEKYCYYSILCHDIVFVCRDKISSRLEELCHSQQLYVATKSRLNSRQKKNLCRDKVF